MRHHRTRGLLLLGCTWLALSAGSLAQDLSAEQRASYRRPEKTPFPESNPYTPQKAALGKMLFFDTRLSRDQNLNCASCHNPSFGWEVPFSTAIGAGGKPLGRHAPTALNHAWTPSLFWDGRAPSLEAQARGPIESPAEMGLPLATAVGRLKEVAGYRSAFDRVYPGQGITEENILKAIATFERTVVSGDTPFDRWVRGDDRAMSESARRGFVVFSGKAGCAACHGGWNFTDNRFHDIGLPTQDIGRKGVTGKDADLHAFRTPSLREIAARAPYMHHGQMRDLEAVVNHYTGGGEARPTRSALIRPLNLSPQERQDLVEFMRSLSSPQSAASLPHLPS